MTTDPDGNGVIELFLEGAGIVVTAVGDEAVGAAWERPSLLAEQTVGSVAGHLARGGVWVVGDYLDVGEPSPPVAFESAAEYYAVTVSRLTDGDHRAIRDRGATIAATGQAGVVAELSTRLAALEERLRALPDDHLISVISGGVMRLGDYLATRIIEQTVHLDDLARSLGRPPWPLPEAAEILTIAIAGDIGRLRHGATSMIRALYRSGFAEPALPVL